MVMCTQDQVEERLQIDYGSDPDPVVAELIASAQAHIETYIGRTIETASRTETFDGPASTLWLRNTPITAMTSVTVDGTALTAADYVWTDYGRLDRTSNSRVVSWATTKLQSIVVVYDGGYVTVPYDLQDVCAWRAARAFQAGVQFASVPAGSEGVKQIMLAGSDSVTFFDTARAIQTAGEFTPSEMMTLNYYRTPPIT